MPKFVKHVACVQENTTYFLKSCQKRHNNKACQRWIWHACTIIYKGCVGTGSRGSVNIYRRVLEPGNIQKKLVILALQLPKFKYFNSLREDLNLSIQNNCTAPDMPQLKRQLLLDSLSNNRVMVTLLDLIERPRHFDYWSTVYDYFFSNCHLDFPMNQQKLGINFLNKVCQK